MSSVNQVITGTKSQIATDAKVNLANFVVKIDKELEKYFNEELSSVYGVSEDEKALSRNIWEHIKEHNLRPAKRLRGSFVYYGYKLLNGMNEEAILNAAMCIEVVHTALLIHDDIMDNDSTRRGKPTTHTYYDLIHRNNSYRFDPYHYGVSMGINVGDIALLAGHQILSRSKFPSERKIEALNHLLRGIINTGFGQSYDVTLEAIGKASEEDIINLHKAKTAIYTYENPLHIGALLAGGNNSDLEIISQYAIPGGIAFQLQDDILGLFGDEEKTGKPAHSDLRQGKMTLLVIKAFENGNSTQVKRLKEIWGKRNLSEEEAEEARKIIIETGSLSYSHEVSIKWAKKAQEAISLMSSWNKEAIEYLNGIAQYMIERED